MSSLQTFHGGIHPPEHKHESTGSPVGFAGIPPQLVLPLSQHVGAPATALVDVGQYVKKGQLLAEATGAVSAAVHAPTSGHIAAIESRPVAHPSGLSASCIVLDSDGDDTWCEKQPSRDYHEEEPAALLDRIRAAGIAGLGGAGFPAAIKLAPRQPIDTLIINGTECEPYITADDMLMRERAADIVEGIRILQHIISPQNTLLGVEDNKPEAIAALQQAVAGTNIEVQVFPTKYPSGGEKQLIEILTGKQVPSGGLPADIGIVCQNVGTCAAIYKAVCLGEPLISRITTLTGQSFTEPQNVEVLLGTPISYLLSHAGFKADRKQRLIMGGPMMGFALHSADVPVVKTTNCILAPSHKELPTPPPAQACIRCGLCAEACPASLLPQQLYWFARGGEFEKLEQHQLFDCIECGACSWVCPSHIPLVQYYRAGKAEIIQLRQESEKAEHAKERFESRQARLERQAEEKEAKRAARKKAAEEKAKAAPGGNSEDDPIAAAIARAKAKKAAQQSAADSGSEIDKLENAVNTARKRLHTAQEKLTQAQAEGSEHVEALSKGVAKTREKLAAAEKALAEHQQASPATPKENASGDAAQDAIARAMAKRQAAANLSPLEKARQDLDKLLARRDKTADKLQASEADGEQEKVLIALRATVERLDDKIAQARSELAALEETDSTA